VIDVTNDIEYDYCKVRTTKNKTLYLKNARFTPFIIKKANIDTKMLRGTQINREGVEGKKIIETPLIQKEMIKWIKPMKISKKYGWLIDINIEE